MKRLTILGIIACVGLLFPPTVAIVGAVGPQDGLEVKVINEQPIPVTGDIGATITGDVTVNNEQSDPVPVKIIGDSQNEDQPFWFHTDNSQNPEEFGSYVVPNDKKLVLKAVSFSYQITSGDCQTFLVIESLQGGTLLGNLSFPPRTPAPYSNFCVAYYNTNITFSPGTTVQPDVFGVIANYTFMIVNLHGNLVSADFSD